MSAGDDEASGVPAGSACPASAGPSCRGPVRVHGTDSRAALTLMSAARDVDPRSSARVQVALTHRLTLVVAAPGWGKTTMLRTLANVAPAVEVARPPAGWTPFSLARQLVDQLVPSALADDLLPQRLAPDSADHHVEQRVGGRRLRRGGLGGRRGDAHHPRRRRRRGH